MCVCFHLRQAAMVGVVDAMKFGPIVYGFITKQYDVRTKQERQKPDFVLQLSLALIPE